MPLARAPRSGATLGRPPAVPRDPKLGSFGAAGKPEFSDISSHRPKFCDVWRGAEIGFVRTNTSGFGREGAVLRARVASPGPPSPLRALRIEPRAHKRSGTTPNWVRSARRFRACLWGQSQSLKPLAPFGHGAEIGFVRPKSRFTARRDFRIVKERREARPSQLIRSAA